jgi:hypothetical protein
VTDDLIYDCQLTQGLNTAEARAYGFEYRMERVIRDTVSEGNIDRVPFSSLHPDVLEAGSVLEDQCRSWRTLTSPVPGKKSPNRWKLAVMTRSVV